MKIEEVEQSLRKAIQRAKDAGLRISCDTFGVLPSKDNVWTGPKECCPLGAVLRDTPVIRDSSSQFSTYIANAATLLGITGDEASSFMLGFDETEESPEHVIRPFWEMGRKFREEFIK